MNVFFFSLNILGRTIFFNKLLIQVRRKTSGGLAVYQKYRLPRLVDYEIVSTEII